MEKRRLSKNLVFTALFAAISAVSGFIAVPIPGTPIPIVLQNMMVVLSGMLLGPLLGTASTVLFIVSGLLGLPVLSGGMGKRISVVRTVIAAVLGFFIMYVPGVLHFMRSLDKTFSETMALCVLPYLPGDAVKTVLCVILAKALRPSVASFVFGDDIGEKDGDR